MPVPNGIKISVACAAFMTFKSMAAFISNELCNTTRYRGFQR